MKQAFSNNKHLVYTGQVAEPSLCVSEFLCSFPLFCNYFYHSKMHFLMHRIKVNDDNISKQQYKSSNRLEERQFFSTNSICNPGRSFFYCDTLQKQVEHLYTASFFFSHN